MLKYYLFIFLTIAFLSRLDAQYIGKNKIALYAPENTFSLSLIEKKLYSLTDEEGNALLKTRGILNINDMLAAEQNQIAASQAKERIIFIRPSKNDTEVERVIQELRDSISQYELFLQINTNSFQGLIEYQFILYPVRHGKTNKDSQVLDFYNKRFATRLFSKDEDILSIERGISNALKELFEKSHSPPKAKISVVQGRAKNIVDTIAIIVKDTLQLDAFYTIDKDTPTEFLKHKWSRIQEENRLPDEKLKVMGNGISCQVIPNETGTFFVELRVLDGVEISKSRGDINKLTKDTIVIIAYSKPTIVLKPSRLQSYFVQNLAKDEERFEYKWDKLRIVSSSGSPKISTDTKSIVFNQEETPEEERRGYSINDTIILGTVEYSNIKLSEKFQIKADLSYGVSRDLALQVNHKVYYPYYLDMSWTHSDFEIDTALGISKDIQVWNEAKLGLNFKIAKRFDMGLQAAFKKMTWESKDSKTYKLTSFGEINATYDIFQKKNARVGVTAFGKFFQIEEPERDYTQLIVGLRGQIGIKMFQGLSEVFLNIALVSKPTSDKFIKEYTEWWSLGFRVFIPN